MFTIHTMAARLGTSTETEIVLINQDQTRSRFDYPIIASYHHPRFYFAKVSLRVVQNS